MKYLMVIGALLLVLGGCSRGVKVEKCKVNDSLKTLEYDNFGVYKVVCNNGALFRYYEKVG